ncbi:unnamed protein product [Closterium sp. NIES-54]
MPEPRRATPPYLSRATLPEPCCPTQAALPCPYSCLTAAATAPTATAAIATAPAAATTVPLLWRSLLFSPLTERVTW